MHFFSSNLKFLMELGKKPEAIKVSRLEELASGPFDPTIDELLFISRSFGISIDDLIKKDFAKDKLILQKEIRFLVIDIDGVMTDGGMYYAESGDELKKFNTKDGMAIKKLTESGMQVGVISSGFNRNLIRKRAELLGVQNVYSGRAEKLEILKEWCLDLDIPLSDVAYIGDDVNDLKIMEFVGLSACPSDAVQAVRNKVHLVLEKKGGEGCVREFCEAYLNQNNLL